MPVTTRAAPLRCQTKEGEIFQVKKTQKKHVQGKNKQKSCLQKHQEQPSSILMDSTAYPGVQDQPNSLQVKSTIEIMAAVAIRKTKTWKMTSIFYFNICFPMKNLHYQQ